MSVFIIVIIAITKYFSSSFGILVSHEEHAVLGSNKKFIDNFKIEYPEWEHSKLNFMNMWKEYSKFNKAVWSWYYKFMEYINS
ncbi:MAG: hypothetical protein GX237_11240 [Clostridiales bacterium]|nr:hypothetical protein [Clostridiales bacterium]